jgi:hypothetical protein
MPTETQYAGLHQDTKRLKNFSAKTTKIGLKPHITWKYVVILLSFFCKSM